MSGKAHDSAGSVATVYGCILLSLMLCDSGLFPWRCVFITRSFRAFREGGRGD